MIVPNCSAVPVARKSIGFATDEPGKSSFNKSSASALSICGISSPPSDNASVSITAGPPAWLIIAIFLPFNSGYINTEATLIKSSRP